MSQSELPETPSRTFSRRPFLAASASLAGIAALSACASSNASDENSASATPTSTTGNPDSHKQFAGTVKLGIDETVELNPVEPVTLTISGGTLTGVEMTTSASGSSVTAVGEISEDKTSWTTTETLLFNSEYEIRWHATDSAGTSGTGTFTFTTVSAAYEADVMLNVTDGGHYGVGMIVQFTFSEPVVNKEEMEAAITISGGGDQAGKFRWYSDYLLRYRPENYWAAHSTVNVQVNMLGMDIGNGMIGNANANKTFTIGDKHFAYADNNTKTIKLYVNDEQVRENKITLGNTDWPSVTGKLIVMEQAASYYFDSSSLGLEKNDSHYYESFWATNVSRLTSGGVFVHQSLPAAYSSIGISNVSHGCIGMLPDDAKYFFDLFTVGDIVETVNTGYPQADPDDGYGDWNIPFENYDDESWRGNW